MGAGGAMSAMTGLFSLGTGILQQQNANQATRRANALNQQAIEMQYPEYAREFREDFTKNVDANMMPAVFQEGGWLDQLQREAGINADPNINPFINNQINNLVNQIAPAEQNIYDNLYNQLSGLQNIGQSGLTDILTQATQGGGIGQDALSQLLGLGTGFAQGQQDVSGFDPYNQALHQLLGQSQGLSNTAMEDAERLIQANRDSSMFEEDLAIQGLNDELASRGLSNSSAGLEALSSARAKFARDRSISDANIRSQANQQAFGNQLSALGLGQTIAQQGGQLQSQQGQLSNADLNARIRALDTSGGLVNMLNALGQGNRAEQANLLNMLTNQGKDWATNLAGVQSTAIRNPYNIGQEAVQQMIGQEQRNLGLQQQQFANTSGVYDRFMNLLSGLSQGFGQSAGQAGAVQGSMSELLSRNAMQSSAGAGQAFSQGLGALMEAFKQPTNTTTNQPVRLLPDAQE